MQDKIPLDSRMILCPCRMNDDPHFPKSGFRKLVLYHKGYCYHISSPMLLDYHLSLIGTLSSHHLNQGGRIVSCNKISRFSLQESIVLQYHSIPIEHMNDLHYIYFLINNFLDHQLIQLENYYHHYLLQLLARQQLA